MFNFPIYIEDDIFGKLKKDSCPSRIDICGNLQNQIWDGNTNYSNIKSCTTTDFFTDNIDESPYGCCVVDSSNDTCDTYVETDIDGKFYDMGIKFMDASMINPRNICHSAPIRKRRVNILDFFVLILISALVLIVTAVIGACYEFWFKYGESIDCIYYKTGCDGRNKLSIIDYMFPYNICEHPYQECNKNTSQNNKVGGKKNMKGGDGNIFEKSKGFISNYAEYKANGAKCVTDHSNTRENTGKPFPYNLVDFANEYVGLEFFRLPLKAFSFCFMYSAIISRLFLNKVMKYLSIGYQNLTNNNSFISNIMFLFFTGILFNVIAHYIKIPELNGANGFILYGLIILVIAGSFIGMVYSILLGFWFPQQFFGTILQKCELSSLYYKLVNVKKLFWSFKEKVEEEPIYKRIGYALLDILSLLPIFIMLIISVTIGSLGSIFYMIFMQLSLIWNTFYIPLSNPIEFFDIIKSHGDLLTILFCISILISSIDKLNTATTGIIGGLLGILIIYKIITNMKK